MISVHIRKRFVYLFARNYFFGGKSNFCFSLSLQFCSSSGERGSTAPTVAELLVAKHQFSPEAASVLTRVKDPQKSESILSFLNEVGFSNAQLEKIVISRKQLLSASLDNTIKPKIKIFQDLGFSRNETVRLLSKEPTILCCSASNRVIPSLSVLKSLLGSNVEVAKVLRKSGWFLIRDLEKTMVPNVEYLKRCGLPMGYILTLLYTCPRILLHKPEALRRSVDTVDKMGVDRSSKKFVEGIRVVGSMTNENWELKLQVFRDLGFSETEILTMFRRAPQVFSGSAEKIKGIKEVLVATGKYDISNIVDHPVSLTCSIENRYIPRLQVIGILEKMNMKKWPTLPTIYLMPDEKFHEKFVAPYLNEVGQVYNKRRAVTARGMEIMISPQT